MFKFSSSYSFLMGGIFYFVLFLFGNAILMSFALLRRGHDLHAKFSIHGIAKCGLELGYLES